MSTGTSGLWDGGNIREKQIKRRALWKLRFPKETW